jgi:hypothetical protein
MCVVHVRLVRPRGEQPVMEQEQSLMPPARKLGQAAGPSYCGLLFRQHWPSLDCLSVEVFVAVAMSPSTARDQGQASVQGLSANVS